MLGKLIKSIYEKMEELAHDISQLDHVNKNRFFPNTNFATQVSTHSIENKQYHAIQADINNF